MARAQALEALSDRRSLPIEYGFMKKKATLATIKSFIAREMKRGQLFIRNKTNFDGMVDCVMPCNDSSFRLARVSESNTPNDLGICGAWFVLYSRDYFEEYEDDNFIGWEVSNCCGSFVLAMPRPAECYETKH